MSNNKLQYNLRNKRDKICTCQKTVWRSTSEGYSTAQSFRNNNTRWRLRLCAHGKRFRAFPKVSFLILSVWRSVHTVTFSRHAIVCLDKNFIFRGFLSPFIFHQMESLLVHEFLKTSSAHYNKVNSFRCMFSIIDTKSVAPSKSKQF